MTSRLSPLVLMTDPKRMTDVVKAAKNMPRGAAIIYRHFGSAHRFVDAEALRQVTFERDQQFLIGADPELAIEVGADGVHFRRDAELDAPILWRQRCPEWLISMAGLKQGDYNGDISVLDALFVSAVFKSRSPSAGEPIGVADQRPCRACLCTWWGQQIYGSHINRLKSFGSSRYRTHRSL